MKTPISDFINGYLKKNTLRLHMPGHKGKGMLGFEERDLTEIEGADVLFSPSGIIKESEEIAKELYGSGKTVYSTEGSSLSIKAMLALAVMHANENGERALILAARNVHKSFIHAAALLDFDVEWIFGESLLTCKLTPSMLEDALKNCTRKPTALYVTSPDYLGNVNGIKELEQLCKAHGILLLVDNAHGAYFRFLPEDIHPISLGADACCDSAHKTLPTLTGGGYLHISKTAPDLFLERADEAMAMFASTSPSYLILESLDVTNAYLSDGYREKLKSFAEASKKAKNRLLDLGYSLLGDEPLKISIKAKDYGYTGLAVAKHLDGFGMVAEFADEDFLTLMLSPEFDEKALDKVVKALATLPKKAPIEQASPRAVKAQRMLTPKEAMLAPSVLVDPDSAVGHILASASISCPPAVPVLVSGELITKEAADALKYYKVEKVRIVRKSAKD